MKNAVLWVALVLAQGVMGQQVRSWKIDKSHASVRFVASHFFTEVEGKFKGFEGTFNLDPEHPQGGSISFTVQVKSVDTGEPDRDKHLQSEDFFHASKWPEMNFVSTRIEQKDKNHLVVHGKLTIRDVTKQVAIPMRITGRMDNPWKEGYEIMGIQIKTSLDRTDYGVGTGSWAATAVVGDEVAISINMELDAKKP